MPLTCGGLSPGLAAWSNIPLACPIAPHAAPQASICMKVLRLVISTNPLLSAISHPPVTAPSPNLRLQHFLPSNGAQAHTKGPFHLQPCRVIVKRFPRRRPSEAAFSNASRRIQEKLGLAVGQLRFSDRCSQALLTMIRRNSVPVPGFPAILADHARHWSSRMHPPSDAGKFCWLFRAGVGRMSLL